jgi:hypothetical protein
MKLSLTIATAAVCAAVYAGSADASTTYLASRGNPFYYGQDGYFSGNELGSTDPSICGAGNNDKWWSIPVRLDSSTTSVSAWQRVSRGVVNSGLVTYEPDGTVYSSTSNTSSNSLGNAGVPAGGYAQVESLFTVDCDEVPNCENSCLAGIKISESS